MCKIGHGKIRLENEYVPVSMTLTSQWVQNEPESDSEDVGRPQDE